MLTGLQFGCGKARLDYSVSLTFYLKTALFGEPTSGLEPLTPAPATSLLPYMQAWPDTSSNLAYLCAHWPLWQRLLSTTLRFIPARLGVSLG